MVVTLPLSPLDFAFDYAARPRFRKINSRRLTPIHVFVGTTRMLHCLAYQLEYRVSVEVRTRSHGCCRSATRASYSKCFPSFVQSTKGNHINFLVPHSELCKLRRVYRGAHPLSSSSSSTLNLYPGKDNSRRVAGVGQEVAGACHQNKSSPATVEGTSRHTSQFQSFVNSVPPRLIGN